MSNSNTLTQTCTHEVLVAGFGGQGVLFTGKILVYAGLLAGNEVSWLPSYGPEMRGGTANCNVIISDKPIGSPIIMNPSVLVVMNQPSLEKFVNDVILGGKIFIDTSLISTKVERNDVTTYYIPATNMAEESGLKGLGNMIMIGKIAREAGVVDLQYIQKAIEKSVPEKKKNLLDSNLKAVDMGFNY